MPLLRLVLTNFRTYEACTWQSTAPITVLTGPNGSGKTNFLEAIALLGPGRGFGRSKFSEMARHGGDGTWGVAGRLWRGGVATDIGTGTEGGERRVFRLDGAAPRSQAELAAHVRLVWLTPQMDVLFQEGASGRRRFLDRLVWALEPGHARLVSAHDGAMAERRRLLAIPQPDQSWLDAIENEVARHAVAQSAARAYFVTRLNAAPLASEAFPRARMRLEDPVAARLAAAPALAVEDWLRRALAARRGADAAAGTSTLGAHRADMFLEDASTGLPAAQASTGQQKALLVGVILAHAALMAQVSEAPILLLDEPAVHLDGTRRAALWETLMRLGAQVFITGTDAEVFAALRRDAQFLSTGAGGLS